MGLSGNTNRTTTVNTPSPQQTAAGNTLNSAFNSAFPRIQGYADQVGGLIPQLVGQVQNGDAGVNASRDWITRTLGNNDGNPFLQQMIDQSGADIGRQVNASLGTRGNIGGSVQAKMLADAMARNSLGLRYNDYNANRQMQAQAAGMAPGVAAGSLAPISALLNTANYAGGAPLQAASQYASGMGGLFGNTGTQTTTQRQGGGLLGSLLGTGLSVFGMMGG